MTGWGSDVKAYEMETDEEEFNVGCKYFESVEYDRIKCKVVFFNSCNPLSKILFMLIHGRGFVPTANERFLVRLAILKEDSL